MQEQNKEAERVRKEPAADEKRPSPRRGGSFFGLFGSKKAAAAPTPETSPAKGAVAKLKAQIEVNGKRIDQLNRKIEMEVERVRDITSKGIDLKLKRDMQYGVDPASVTSVPPAASVPVMGDTVTMDGVQFTVQYITSKGLLDLKSKGPRDLASKGEKKQRDQAFLCLKRKKMYEKRVEEIGKEVMNLAQQVVALENEPPLPAYGEVQNPSGGGGGAPTALQDISKAKEQIEVLNKRVRHIVRKMDAEFKSALAAKAKGDKAGAMMCMKRRKALEGMRNGLMNAITHLEDKGSTTCGGEEEHMVDGTPEDELLDAIVTVPNSEDLESPAKRVCQILEEELTPEDELHDGTPMAASMVSERDDDDDGLALGPDGAPPRAVLDPLCNARDHTLPEDELLDQDELIMRELNELEEKQDLEEDLLLQLQDMPPVPVPPPDYLAQFKRKPKKGAWPWMKSFFMAQEFVYVIEEDAELKRLEAEMGM